MYLQSTFPREKPIAQSTPRALHVTGTGRPVGLRLAAGIRHLRDAPGTKRLSEDSAHQPL